MRKGTRFKKAVLFSCFGDYIRSLNVFRDHLEKMRLMKAVSRDELVLLNARSLENSEKEVQEKSYLVIMRGLLFKLVDRPKATERVYQNLEALFREECGPNASLREWLEEYYDKKLQTLKRKSRDMLVEFLLSSEDESFKSEIAVHFENRIKKKE